MYREVCYIIQSPNLLHFSYINQYCTIGCGYPSFFVYYEHGYLNLALQTGGVFLYHITSIIYSETKVRMFNSSNSCLQNVLVLTATIDPLTHFWILSILAVNSPPAPPKMIYQTGEVSEML